MNDLAPIFICCVMPIAIVYLVFRAQINKDNRRAEVLMKAIEANNYIDADKLANVLQKSTKTAREILNLRLLRGCIFSFIGIALVIVGWVNYLEVRTFGSDSVTVSFLSGGVSLAVGLSYLIVYFVTRKQADSSDAE